MNNVERFKTDLSRLHQVGQEIYWDFIKNNVNEKDLPPVSKEYFKDLKHSFANYYQSWYSESLALLKQILPSRLNEFQELYSGKDKRKNIKSNTYNIQDWLMGIRAGTNVLGEKYFYDVASVVGRLDIQKQIIESAMSYFDSSIFEIKQLLRADLFDSELEAAGELLKNGFLRAAGAVAGVILEAHLNQVRENHNIKILKKSPTINDLNDLLYNQQVYDIITFRFVIRLGDIRNYCDHKKEREPTTEEVKELIDGTEKIIKTVF
jgi:hypothetical protein